MIPIRKFSDIFYACKSFCMNNTILVINVKLGILYKRSTLAHSSRLTRRGDATYATGAIYEHIPYTYILTRYITEENCLLSECLRLQILCLVILLIIEY